MKKLYSFPTPLGTFYICVAARSYFAMLDTKLLDSFSTPEQAARAVAEGRGFSLPEGMRALALAVPADLRKWRRVE